MDHTYPLGPSRHYNNSGGNSQHYRISPVNLPGTSRNSSSSSNNGSISQQQIYNSVSSIFGTSGVLPQNFFGRPGSSSSYLNPVVTPNHFNFPLRSNSANNSSSSRSFNNGGNNSSSSGSSNGGLGGTSCGGGGIGGGNYNNRNRNSPNQSSMNKSRQQQGSSSVNGNSANQHSNGSKSQCQNGDSRNTSGSNDTPEPQYRIFKRGDTLPGMSMPGNILTNANENECLENTNNSSSAPILNDGSGCLGTNNFDQENNPAGSDLKEDGSSDAKNSNQPNKTPVSLVRDIARFHGMSVEYRLTGEKGPPHSPTFTVVLHLGPSEEYVGQGSSIKRAQHAAAAEALDKTALSKPTTRTIPKRPYGLAGKRPNWALLQLTSLADELKEPISIVQQPITIIDPFRRGDPPSVVSIHVGERIFTGEGSNFNAAKNMAAMIALKAMLKVKQEMELKKLAESGTLLGQGENGISVENKSPISVVHEMAMKRGLNVKFEVVREEGPPHNKVFTVMCSLGGEECSAEGQGPTKQAAKKTASEFMIEKLRELPPPSTSPQIGSLKSIQKGLLRQKNPRKKTSAPVVKDLDKQTVSPISRLIQIAHVRKYKEPEFNLVASSNNGPANDDISSILRPMSERERRNIRKKKPTFTMEVIVGPHCCRGIGPNKKAAKKAAAESALVELGYGPTLIEDSSNDATDKPTANKTGKTNGETTKSSKSNSDKNKNSMGNLTSARQIVPGVIVLNTESKEQKTTASPTKIVVAQELAKVSSIPAPPAPSRDGTEKLAYLAKLLGVVVSYSDFPKKNEYLSVVSLGTSPPHVAHGCGATLDDAQNTAALKILEELSDVGLDSINQAEDSM